MPENHVVVLKEVGNATVSQGKDVAREFRRITGRPLPLPVVSALDAVRERLVAEFPYATAAVDQILEGLVEGQQMRLRPTVLLGPPGCGKSRFARRLAEELGAPYELIPCGGMSDSALGGTPRRWSSGEPSLPILAVSDTRLPVPSSFWTRSRRSGQAATTETRTMFFLGCSSRKRPPVGMILTSRRVATSPT